MKNLIETLKAEHQYILKEIEAIESDSLINPKRLKSLFEFIELVHHDKEETLLFPHIANQQWLKQGGPLCSFFMGIRIDIDPLSRMKKHLQQFYNLSKQAVYEKKKFSWLITQSPLSIPMEEHEIGDQLSKGLLYLLEQNRKSSQENDLFKLLLHDYFELLKAHIQKEDMCLFSQCLIKTL